MFENPWVRYTCWWLGSLTSWCCFTITFTWNSIAKSLFRFLLQLKVKDRERFTLEGAIAEHALSHNTAENQHFYLRYSPVNYRHPENLKQTRKKKSIHSKYSCQQLINELVKFLGPWHHFCHVASIHYGVLIPPITALFCEHSESHRCLVRLKWALQMSSWLELLLMMQPRQVEKYALCI